MDRERIRVGVLMRKARFEALISSGLFFSPGDSQSFTFSHIDPLEPIKAGEGFEILLHKISDFLDEWGSHEKAAAYVDEVVANFPGIMVVDELDHVCQVFDRLRMAETIATIPCTSRGGYRLSAPAFVKVLPDDSVGDIKAKALAAGLWLPCILKDRSACGGKASHHMSLILSWEGMHRAPDGRPRILQNFVNHGGVIHKVYVIGDQVHVVQKESIADLPALSEGALDSLPAFLDFDSLLMTKTLAKLGKLDGLPSLNPNNLGAPPLDNEVVSAAVVALKGRWPLTLFGFDVVVHHSGDCFIIDVNYFPSFKGFPDAAQHLQAALQRKLQARKNGGYPFGQA